MGQGRKESSSGELWDDTSDGTRSPRLQSSLSPAPSFSVLSPFHLRPDMPNCSQLTFSSLSFSPSRLLLFPSLLSSLFVVKIRFGHSRHILYCLSSIFFYSLPFNMNKPPDNQTFMELACPNLSHLTPPHSFPARTPYPFTSNLLFYPAHLHRLSSCTFSVTFTLSPAS